MDDVATNSFMFLLIHICMGLTCPLSHEFTCKSESLQILMQYDVETSYFQNSNLFCVYLLPYLLDFLDFWILMTP